MKKLFTETKNKASPTNIKMINPEDGIKLFSRSVDSNVKHLFLRNMVHHNNSIGLCYKNNYFRVDWKCYRPVELKRIMEGGYQLMKSVGRYGCLTNKNSWKCLQWLEIPWTFVVVGDASFYHKSFFKELFKANPSFWTSHLTEGFRH